MLSTTLPLAMLLLAQTDAYSAGPPSPPAGLPAAAQFAPESAPPAALPGDQYQPQFARPLPFRSTPSSGSEPVPVASAASGWLTSVWSAAQEASPQPAQFTLVEAIQRGSASGQRAAAVRAYWQLCGRFVERHLAEDLLLRLDELEPLAARQPGSLWAAVRADAAASVRSAELELLRAQGHLDAFGSFVTQSPSAPRAVPLDAPLVSAYRTNFATLFPAGAASPALKQLHDTLPLELQAIEARAEAVESYAAAFDELSQAQPSAQANVASLLEALERWQAQRLQLVRLIVQYNLRVADYALAIGGAENDTTVAGMLVPSPRIPVAAVPLATTPLVPATLQPVTGIQPLEPVPGSPRPVAAAAFREVPAAPAGVVGSGLAPRR